MICKPCAIDADWQTWRKDERPPVERARHEACKGCDCQHEPVKEGQING